MIINTPFHKLYGRSFARVLYLILMKDRSVTPLDAARVNRTVFQNHSVIMLYAWYISPRWTSGSPRMLLVLVREFESRRGKISNLSAIKKKDQLKCWDRLAWLSTIRRKSTREERAEIFSREKGKARTVVGRGGEEPAMWPRIWVTTRREKIRE